MADAKQAHERVLKKDRIHEDVATSVLREQARTRRGLTHPSSEACRIERGPDMKDLDEVIDILVTNNIARLENRLYPVANMKT